MQTWPFHTCAVLANAGENGAQWHLRPARTGTTCTPMQGDRCLSFPLQQVTTVRLLRMRTSKMLIRLRPLMFGYDNRVILPLLPLIINIMLNLYSHRTMIDVLCFQYRQQVLWKKYSMFSRLVIWEERSCKRMFEQQFERVCIYGQNKRKCNTECKL